MTISSTTRTAGPFIGNGSASVFPFTFKVFQAADVSVTNILVATGLQTGLNLNTDYTVALNPNQDTNPGGSITLTAGALASGYNLAITSNVANLQPTELTNQGGFYPEVLTASLDRATIQIQQLQTETDLSLAYPITDPTVSSTLPAIAQRAGMLLGFDANGVPLAIAPTVGVIGSGVAIIPFSSTPVLNAGQGSLLKITLTGNVTSSTLSVGSAANAFFAVKIVQDAVGGHTFAWPANFHNAGAVDTVANSTSTQLFAIDTDGSATALGPIMYS